MRICRHRFVCVVALLVVLGWGTTAQAQIIQYTFEGAVTSGEDVFGVLVGTPVTAVVTYDLASPDLFTEGFDHENRGVYAALTVVVNILGDTLECPQGFGEVWIVDDPSGFGGDFLNMICRTSLEPKFGGSLEVTVAGVGGFSYENPFDSQNLPDESLSLTDLPGLLISLTTHDAQVCCTMQATVDSILGEVLIPSSVEQLIEELLEDIVALNLRAGISNALDAKVEAVMNALGDANENNDVAAINAMNALINAVEAQRGKTLTDDQADMLIAAALEVIDLIEKGVPI